MENNVTKLNNFSGVSLRIAGPEKIAEWSRGEVTKPETINYRNQRYEKDGLFCERIFGPSKDWECYCGKYKKIRYKGIVCDKCGVEVTRSSVRRERMGHIKLAVPVSHIWFLRGVPSKIGLALNMSSQELERVIYFSAYLVISVDEKAKESVLSQLENEYKTKKKELQKASLSDADRENALNTLQLDYETSKEDIKNLRPMKILSELDYFNFSTRFGHIFRAGIGAEVVREALEKVDIDKEIKNIRQKMEMEGETANQKKLFKRLKFFQEFKTAGLKLEWMMPTSIPVIPPDLRPMVALDGGRFATSDLNDLYRRIINRNNRLKKLLEVSAPEVIVRNEKRMLQEAVDSLFDNGMRRSQTSVQASTGQKRALRSIADSLKGKQGRFRQNLLGKRVDYSGRSVIVVGPKLKLWQAGLPKKMALELFKPFIINQLIEKEHAYNVRTAGRMVDAETEEAYEILDKIIKHHYVLLNRAPTLHRLSIQAFQPVLIEGKAIQIHPMVCAAFNADFDGDQMAVHVPLTDKARQESEEIMLSAKNILKPASGDPITTPSQDIVLGIYYLTSIVPGGKGENKIFSSVDEVILAYDSGAVGLRSQIKILYKNQVLETSPGRVIFNDILPEKFKFLNEEMTKSNLKNLMAEILEKLGREEVVDFVDKIKALGFKMATKSGISWGMDDLEVPREKEAIISEAEEKVRQIKDQYNAGFLTNEERKDKVIAIWNEAKGKVADAVKNSLNKEGVVYAMIHSKARGSESVVVQMTGMKGLMAGPTGETIELPVKSSFKEGFKVLEYFISTHGARKGMADTALRTSTAGYLTRRLVDVARDVIISEDDCKDKEGSYLYREDSDKIGQSFAHRVEGRVLLEEIKDKKGNVLAKKGDLVTKEQAIAIEKENIEKVKIRSVVSCKTRRGICSKCYGLDLGRNHLVEVGQAVGVVAAQAIGEPGTQLTMRTFHVGGVAGTDITQGLPRVQEIFEVRSPKGETLICEESGKVLDIRKEDKFKIIVIESTDKKGKTKEYQAPLNANLRVEKGDLVAKGSFLIEGSADLKKIYKLMGKGELHRYIVREIQEIYASQGEAINDKHIEIIIRQMLNRTRILDSGDTNLLVGDIIEKAQFEDANEKAIKEGKSPAKGESVLMGITKVALSTESFLAAASFQSTARVLIDAACSGKEDKLRGLKENVIIGRLIPAGTGFHKK